MRRTLLATVALFTALTGCYEVADTGGFPGSDIATLEITDASGAQANGHTIVHILLKVAPNTARTTSITVETSSGALTASADPTSADSRRISVNNLGTGVIPLALRVGNKPGTTIITANVGGFVTTQELRLSPSLPDRIVLSAPKTSIAADGESKLDVTATLLADDTTQLVSRGARVRLAICCPSAAGDPEPCSGPDPMTIPTEAQLGDGQAILVQAVTQRIVSSSQPVAPIPLFVVARAVNSIDDEAVSLCGVASPLTAQSDLSLAVRPLAAP